MGQENYGLFPLFGTFLFLIASLLRHVRPSERNTEGFPSPETAHTIPLKIIDLLSFALLAFLILSGTLSSQEQCQAVQPWNIAFTTMFTNESISVCRPAQSFLGSNQSSFQFTIFKLLSLGLNLRERAHIM